MSAARFEKFEKRIKQLIEEEHAEYIDADTPIIQTGIDSFGYMMVLLGINEEYKIFDDKNKLEEMDFENLTVKMLYDRYIELNEKQG